VAGQVQSLSDTLAVIEDGIQRAMENVYVEHLPQVVTILKEAHGKGPRTATSAAKELGSLATAAVVATKDLYENLQAQTFEEGIRSIGAELEVCEQTLAAKYRGLTDEAMAAVSGFSTTIEDVGNAQYLVHALAVVPWFEERTKAELLTSRTDDLELAVLRWVSTSPLQVTNHTGRGLWWKVFEHGNRITRETQFATLNTVRSQVMHQFNVLGEKR
jgi:hypothetical protein